MMNQAGERGSARFFDESNRDRGWSNNVTQRSRGLGNLTVLDIAAPDGGLADFLRHLDKSRLIVQYTDEKGAALRFRWASGYPNGNDFRIQGVLENG